MFKVDSEAGDISKAKTSKSSFKKKTINSIQGKNVPQEPKVDKREDQKGSSKAEESSEKKRAAKAQLKEASKQGKSDPKPVKVIIQAAPAIDAASLRKTRSSTLSTNKENICPASKTVPAAVEKTKSADARQLREARVLRGKQSR